ncbi:uncharacterized protein BX663DRAFT_497474 [Cokeromyces recurvatus]|uniref:uncharacterized protein n=1 Tax=Cokeromyces recurvatus TaxID=90255 RepID=UPI00222039DD|nr:uncharacterized protein BX663DRAFT_497474 [Cokeromyces recurvatus]KAI7906738.1 hypothetical protein BX663DRAFT_497474 [Cokeromyces recurvatus]
MPPPLTSFTTLLTLKTKPLASKTLGPLSSTVLRQQQQQHNYTTTNVKKAQIVTEKSVLDSFPRPNLQPTLHMNMYNLQVLKALNPIQTCFNCNGPHSTEFCPC